MTDALREALGVELREVRTPMPEVLIASVPSRVDASDEWPHAVRRLARSGSSYDDTADAGLPRSRRSAGVDEKGPADPTAATVAYSPERVVSELERSGRIAIEPPPGSGLGTIVAVAAIALGLGVGGGVFALQRFDRAKELIAPTTDSVERAPGAVGPENSASPATLA
jgi:hypothetical protein